MNIVDVVIILMILMYGVIGLKRGVFKETAIVVGTIAVIILAFYFKDPLASWLSLNLPFFNFGGTFAGLTSLNIVMYQLIAFLLIAGILTAILNVVISITGVFEKFLKLTIILGIPSKILGFIVGLVNGFIIVYIVLFFISQPAFNIEIVNQSKMTSPILKSTPGLSNIMKDFNLAFSDIYKLSESLSSNPDKNEFNKQTIEVLLKYKIVKANHVIKLLEKGKLKVVGIDQILNNYR